MEIIVISTPTLWDGENDALSLLVDLGIKKIHYRKPGLTIEEMNKELSKMDVSLKSNIMLHTHHSLVNEHGLRGMHYSQASMDIEDLTPCSAGHHTLDSVIEFARQFEYNFCSPVYDSISKRGYDANHDVITWPQKTSKDNLVALGGILPKHCSALHQAGFTGIAVLGGLWDSKTDLASRLTEYQSAC